MQLVFVPVRHHSPACARLVQQLFAALRPSRVLIEGPSDFEPLAELLLPHQLPIAIYSYVRDKERRAGTYYPFCVYSPEWQAIQCAGSAGVPFEFIDLPSSQLLDLDPDGESRYADGALRRSRLIDAVCVELGVEDFDAAWDTLFEVPQDLTPEALHQRVSAFCSALRQADEEAGAVSRSDLLREAFMRARIAQALHEADGQGTLLVITGGYHTPALSPRTEPAWEPLEPASGQLGSALTPYSFERLDAHTGYAAGMPSPGFYQALWDGVEPLSLAATALRAHKQQVSTADLISAQAIARGLAALRGHARVFRSDLLDGARAALVKDTLEGDAHPLLSALLAAFRGGARGRLAAGTRRPPLALELEHTLSEAGIWPAQQVRTVPILLRNPDDLSRSRLLHRVLVLRLHGFERLTGTDFATRSDLSEPRESWQLCWSPELEADCIEAALYGGSFEEAVVQRLRERAEQAQHDAESAARICLDVALCGFDAVAAPLVLRLSEVVRAESDFARLAQALSHLLYLYRFDAALGSAGKTPYLSLLTDAYERGVWLLTSLGDAGPSALAGVARLLEARRRCAEQLRVEPLRDVLHGLAHDGARPPALRGAAAGGLFALGDLEASAVAKLVHAFARPEQLGDFLTGLFTVGREAVRTEPLLMQRLDELLLAFSDDDFLLALPALRLSFSFFPPREKHHLMRRLLETLGDRAAPLPALAVEPVAAAATLALETRLLATLARHGIRPLVPIAPETEA
jgi:hypothetical protein